MVGIKLLLFWTEQSGSLTNLKPGQLMTVMGGKSRKKLLSLMRMRLEKATCGLDETFFLE